MTDWLNLNVSYWEKCFRSAINCFHSSELCLCILSVTWCLFLLFPCGGVTTPSFQTLQQCSREGRAGSAGERDGRQSRASWSWPEVGAGLINESGNGRYQKGISRKQGDSRVTAVALSGSPGSSAGSHHFHGTIPTEAIDNAHSADFVLHFLLQLSCFLPQALPLLLSASFCFLPLLFLLQLRVLTLVGLFTQTFNPDRGQN